MTLISRQKALCDKYGAEYSPISNYSFLSISKGFDPKSFPINGLRHSEMKSSGWFIWSGDYSDSDDFFETIHAHHMNDICDSVIKYLALAPGWRFLFDNDYEDVWYDPDLIP